MKKNVTELGKYIHEAREKVGISQRELARQANMDCAEISRIEAGKRLKPNILYLKGIAETLNLSMVDLMKLAGYDDIEINWGRDFSDRRSTADYQKQIKSYEKFYFDVLADIDKRRYLDLDIQNEISNLIHNLERAQTENKEMSNEVILNKLTEIMSMFKPNLEKFDKSKYPTFDSALTPPMKITSNIKYITIPKELIDTDK